MNYLKLERIRREREKKKEMITNKKDLQEPHAVLWPELPVEVEFTKSGFM